MKNKKQLIEDFENYKKRIDEAYAKKNTQNAYVANVELLFDLYVKKVNLILLNLLMRYNEFLYMILK